jgi:protein involved in polysaccharide export with SLBB domain
MKKAYWTIAVCCLAVALAAPLSLSRAQTGVTAAGNLNQEDGRMRLLMPYQSYAQYALDMVLRYQSGFVGSAVDPDEYIVGPGDRFTISFVSGDIGDIGCQIGSAGELFIKSVGAVDLTGKSLRETLAAMQQAVAQKYTGADFTVQMTGFRFIPVQVIGEVSGPGVYYAPAMWRVSEVIGLAGGLTPQGLPRRIILKGGGRSLPVDLVRFNTVGDKTANPMVCAGNTVIVPNRNECDEFVTVAGLVNRPGVFAVVEGDRISDYLAYAGGVSGTLADMMVAISNPDSAATVTLDGAQKAVIERLPHAGDNITVAWRDGPGHNGDVVIFGAVVSPGRYPVTGTDFTFSDLLQLCGGIDGKGYADMIQVYRLNKNMASTLDMFDAYNDQTAPARGGAVIARRTRLSLDPRHSVDLSRVKLMDGDSIYVPHATGMITVTGAVASPGLVHYREGESVDYYLQAAGGLGFDADKSRMVVFNPATGGEISAASAGRLFDGEVLFVPRKETSEKP